MMVGVMSVSENNNNNNDNKIMDKFPYCKRNLYTEI
jgi:hypothetical protein